MAKKPRGRVIDDQIIEVILYILEGWKGKLTWDALIAAIKASISTEYTRQALSGHKQIADAFVLRKSTLAKQAGRPVSSDNRVNALSDAVARLTSENERLKAELNSYRSMFIRWTANAQKKGITSKMLDAPLVKPDRGQTDE